MRGVALMVSGVLWVSCAPVLRLSRPTPPRFSLGGATSVGVTVRSSVPTFSSGALTSLSVGGVLTPVPIPQVIKERFEGRLQGLEVAVCAAPCGQGTLVVDLLQVDVNPQAAPLGGTGPLATSQQVHARLVVRARFVTAAGAVRFEQTISDARLGPVEDAAGVVRESAEVLAARLQASLLPGRERWRVKLIDSPQLGPGVKALTAGEYAKAAGHFQALTEAEPTAHAAWYDLGAAYEAQLDWPRAVEAYARAASLSEEGLYRSALTGAKTRASSLTVSDSGTPGSASRRPPGGS